MKHQQRSHQQGINPNGIENCSLDSGDDESPSTPQSSSTTWLPYEMVSMNQDAPNGSLHHASSYIDFETQVYGHHMPQYYDNRQKAPASVLHEYHGAPVPEQNAYLQLVHRAVAVPEQVAYVSEAGSPGVATMTSHVPGHDLLPTQVEWPPMELPCSAPGITTSIQSEPSTFHPTSVPGLMIPEGFNPHQSGSQSAYTSARSQAAMGQD
ncbi:hypothetical protein Forpe1208_v016161 [Fusarium oxysporum f. sp. rapae]|uniref:Uncharacterized protein n=1 Tax=Fusarium oxysporum f. sp. rapae TaxID=485398 RepID=A0A8J5NPA5_FUSOX|nr:hypothetical protein Forpe1208_v016161 [Fusarium oxysporum f. sp. rapae]